MARRSQTGVRGLYQEAATGHFEIDFRWADASSGLPRRYTKRLGAMAPSAAGKYAQRVTASILAGTFDPGKVERPKRLKEALAAYLDVANTNTPKSAAWRTSQSKHITNILGDVPLQTLSTASAEKIKSEHSKALCPNGKPHSPTSVNLVLTIFRHFCSWMAHRSRGWIKRDVADDIGDVKKLKQPRERVRSATDAEKAGLRLALRPADWTVIQVALMTGLRRFEIAGLKKADVNLQALVISPSVTKGDKPREVEIPPTLVPILEMAMANPTDHVFMNPLTRRPYAPKTLTNIFARARKRAGIENLRLHDTRHTYATEARRRGVGLDVVQQLLGHSTIAMTSRYAHINSDMRRAAVADCQPLPQAAESADNSPKLSLVK